MNLVKVKDHHSLYRDVDTGAILTINSQEYQDHVTFRNKKLQELNEKKLQEEKINNLEKEVSELKQLILQLVKEQKDANQ